MICVFTRNPTKERMICVFKRNPTKERIICVFTRNPTKEIKLLYLITSYKNQSKDIYNFSKLLLAIMINN